MNMFKKSRKVKDSDEGTDGLSNIDNAPFAKASRALTRKKKKQVEEKPEFDLTSALPDSNDFRTSLLMPTFSARFSMLREQDDPTTKVGKASDDSVLFPKRSSRLMLFNNNPLSDIAEVESIRGSFRPPFADDRKNSFSDGYASDDGASMMNRSRPGEGNNLFGGRQKLYKIATGSTRDIPSADITRGKHTYESDVALSAFQQMRLKEKEQREQQQRDIDERTDRSSYPNTESEEVDSARSPATAFSKNRGTQSSTNSGPSYRRTSTAATSVVSESPLPQSSNMIIHKVRDQDANSSAESIGFATSPAFRTVIRDDGKSTFRLSGSRSAINMRDTYTRQSPVPPPQTFRGMSPPLSAQSQPLDFGLGDSNKPQSTSRLQTTSPTSQFEFEQDETLANNVRPNDRGKATAMGLFNKPARHYDEAQFQQRQMQMHEGRNSPISASSRAASRGSPEVGRSSRPRYGSTMSGWQADDRHTPQIPPIPGNASPVPSNRRTSATSTGRRSTSRPRTKSSASHKEAAVKARVESLIRRQNAELAALEESAMGPLRQNEEAEVEEANQVQRETFFDNSDNSDDEEVHSSAPTPQQPRSMPEPPIPKEVHPALRQEMGDFDFGTEQKDTSNARESHYSVASRTLQTSTAGAPIERESVFSVDEIDSPTLPGTGLGLSGLIRTHLRHDSDKSSMLPPPSPMLPGFDTMRGSVSSTTRTVTESVKSDPFEYDTDRLTVRQPSAQLQQPPTPTTMMSNQAQQMLQAAKAIRDAAAQADVTPKLGTGEAEHETENSSSDPRTHHRTESTETQREMQRFDDELAARRKKIEEGLKSVQERSRSRSPHVERSTPSSTHGFLPRFPGRSNIGDRFEHQAQTKAMKMLGISAGSKDLHSQPSPRIPLDQRPNEYDAPRQRHSRQGHRSSPEEERQHGRYTPNSGRSAPRNVPYSGYDRPPPPRSTTPSSRPGQRSRSNSAAADRSASRNKHVPDFDPSMMPQSPFMNGSPRAEHKDRSGSPGGRPSERSGSSAAGHYAERPGLYNNRPLAPSNMGEGSAPRPSPRPSPNPQLSSESIQSSQLATPMSPPSSAMSSPNPLTGMTTNGRTTPISVPGRVTPSGTRKRSVTKGMISEPTFVSSTSTVPLVHLPRDGGPAVEPLETPPVPAMNPRRRGTAGNEQNTSSFSPHPAVRPNASPLPVMPESPNTFDFGTLGQTPNVPPAPRQRNKLRKSSSEGGNMAARARQQALAAEFQREKDRSPNVAVFPNRSATSLHTDNGGMF